MNAFEAGRRGYKHKNLLFWLGMINSLVTPVTREDHVLDLGCGHGLFLPLLYEIQPFKEGVGIDTDHESIEIARRRTAEQGAAWPIRYVHADDVQGATETYDVVFGQEVIWWNADLAVLARQTYALLKPGGRCYFTMGSHPQNPLWERRRERMARDGIQSYSWTIDDVARAFTDVGFAVGLRRVPIDGFFMYHPEATIESAGSLYDLVQATTETKMLFYFGKHGPVERAATLRG